MVIGSLRPANTWDLPTYLALAVVAVAYTALRYAQLIMGRFFEWPEQRRKLFAAAGSIDTRTCVVRVSR